MYGSLLELQINLSIPEIFGFPAQEYRPTLSLCEDMAQVRADAISHAKELVRNGKAVFTIGVDWSEQELLAIAEDDAIAEQIKEDVDLTMFQNKLARFTRGIVSLPPSFDIGVDLRFDCDAFVIIAT